MLFVKCYILVLLLLLSGFLVQAQKVALVFSGGGAKGLVHLGAIKALEENNIPIDVITGTSMGAIIGGMYASGYTIDEIVEQIKSDEFKSWSTGKYEHEFNYYYKTLECDAEMFSLRMNLGRSQKNKISLPTNLIPPYQMDLALLHIFSQASAACHNNFDSLMIPFRAMSYDAYGKKPYCPHHGNLSTVIRASMSFPGIFKPAVIDSLLLFDGGIVNNFPVNVAIEEFDPDFILGINCSYNYDRPTEDDVVSQITSLTSNFTNYSIPADKGFVINFDSLTVGLMDFGAISRIIDIGYRRTIAVMPQIKERVARRRLPEELEKMRDDFDMKKSPLLFKNVAIDGGSEKVQEYVKDEMRSVDDTTFTFEELRERYFGVISDGGVNTFFPSATYNFEDSIYDLKIRMTETPRFKLGIGGSYSSFSNMAFLSFSYAHYALVSTRVLGNVYLGSVYNSQKLHARFDTRFHSTNMPLFWEAMAVHNSFDYYSKNPDLIYEDTKPDFIHNREVYGRVNVGTKLFSNGLIKAGYTYANVFENYYTTKNFTTEDIPENMRFEASSLRGIVEHNTYDYKVFPTKGTQQYLTFNYVGGREYHKYGTTSEKYLNGDTAIVDKGYEHLKYHNLLTLKFKRTQYLRPFKCFGIGYHLEGVLSKQVFFQDYYSTLLMLPVFEPLPNFQGLFLENYRSSLYIAAGIMPTYYFSDRIFLRGELYLFQPFSNLNKDNTVAMVKPEYSWNARTFYFVGASSLVYQTFLGPLSLMFTYYQNQGSNYYFSLNFGYYLFNSRALD